METIENSTPKSKHIYVRNYFKSVTSPTLDTKLINSSKSENESDKFISFNSNLDNSKESSTSACGTGSDGTTANSPIINRHLSQTPKNFNKWNNNGNIKVNNLDSAGATGGGDAPFISATCSPKKLQYSLDDIMRNISALGQTPENLLIATALIERLRLNSNGCEQQGQHIMSRSHERYSRKVFVGGFPPDIDEQQIAETFQIFGPLIVDWPHKCETVCSYPPKGYAFLLFQHEQSVQQLISACVFEDGKLYMAVSSPTIKDKSVQIRPWRLSDADFVLDPKIWLDPRKTVFVGGVPRPLKAKELAFVMERHYGGVCYASIDTDPELKYPKGAARVCFSDQQSYIAAISAQFLNLQYADIEKRVEVKPYVLDDQICDECKGMRCVGKFAPYFCANINCLQYYCEQCWIIMHSRPGCEFHKPLVKEGTDRPRPAPIHWK